MCSPVTYDTKFGLKKLGYPTREPHDPSVISQYQRVTDGQTDTRIRQTDTVTKAKSRICIADAPQKKFKLLKIRFKYTPNIMGTFEVA